MRNTVGKRDGIRALQIKPEGGSVSLPPSVLIGV